MPSLAGLVDEGDDGSRLPFMPVAALRVVAIKSCVADHVALGHALLVLVQNWRADLDTDVEFGTLALARRFVTLINAIRTAFAEGFVSIFHALIEILAKLLAAVTAVVAHFATAFAPGFTRLPATIAGCLPCSLTAFPTLPTGCKIITGFKLRFSNLVALLNGCTPVFPAFLPFLPCVFPTLAPFRSSRFPALLARSLSFVAALPVALVETRPTGILAAVKRGSGSVEIAGKFRQRSVASGIAGLNALFVALQHASKMVCQCGTVRRQNKRERKGCAGKPAHQRFQHGDLSPTPR